VGPGERWIALGLDTTAAAWPASSTWARVRDRRRSQRHQPLDRRARRRAGGEPAVELLVERVLMVPMQKLLDGIETKRTKIMA
jgi:hypothetical protein